MLLPLISKKQPYNETFETRIEQIQREFRKLRQKIDILTEDNERLHSELDKYKQNHTLPVDQYSETERLAMRQHIIGLIEKIDHYLDDSTL